MGSVDIKNGEIKKEEKMWRGKLAEGEMQNK
jgi:hypothetical protein